MAASSSDEEHETSKKKFWHKCKFSKSALWVIGILATVHFILLTLWNQYPEMFDRFSLVATNNTLELSPSIKGKVFLIILINTIPKNTERRQTLRQTWAGTGKTGGPRSQNVDQRYHKNLGVYCVFMVAFSEVISENRKVYYESTRYGDILRINTKESYRNMITKVWAGYEWAFKLNPKFFMKTDDDIYVDMPHLVHWLHAKYLPRKLYAGWVLKHGRIMRNQGSDWYVSHAEFHERSFPDYCIGPFYVISGNILGTIVTNKKKVKMFNVEDAYLGVLMRSLHVSPMNVGKIFVWDPRLPNMLPKWNIKKYSEVICLGERLTSKLLRYIHLKYETVHKTAEYDYSNGFSIKFLYLSALFYSFAVTYLIYNFN